jgi:ATP-dependent RNA helicase DDX54/DBP10
LIGYFAGKDVVAMARTGSGKTAAFLIPLVERLQQHSTRVGARAVVLSPTRELALQTLKFVRSLAKFTDLRFASLVGGEGLSEQFSSLADNPDVLIATPGRLVHLLSEVSSLHLRAVQYVVFDEADRLFEMGFADQLREVLTRMPQQRQTLIVSATLPKALAQFAQAGLRDPELIRLDTDTKVSEALRLAFFTVRREEKPAALLWVLRRVIPEDQQAIVFASTRHHVEFITVLLQLCGLDAAPVYGKMDQSARVRDPVPLLVSSTFLLTQPPPAPPLQTANLARFRGRRLRFLIVTDVAARGLDLPLLE